MTTWDDAQFEHSLLALAHEALHRAGHSVTRVYRIADTRMKVVANAPFLLDRYLSSINHLTVQEDAENADFQIYLLDSKSSGIPYPNRQVSFDQAAPLKFHGSDSSKVLVSATADDKSLYAANLSQKLGVCWLKDAMEQDGGMPARPLRHLIHWFMTERNYQLVHAGAVADEHGAVAFVGPSGCGKSTSCVNLMAAGMDYLGDDFVLVGNGTANSVLSVFNLYSIARIHKFSDKLKPLEELAMFYDGKFAVPLNPFYKERICSEAPLKALIYPHWSDSSGEPIAISKSQALRRTLCTLGYLPGHEAASLNHLSQLVRQLPCYSLAVSTNVEPIRSAVKKLLLELPPPAVPA